MPCMHGIHLKVPGSSRNCNISLKCFKLFIESLHGIRVRGDLVSVPRDVQS